jgi:hypothetical protein
MMNSNNWIKKQQIASTISAFAWRDQGRWTELRDLFAEQANISVSWYSGSIEGFIDASTNMASTGKAQTKHWFGVPRISVCDDRALAETDIAIMIRSSVGPLEVDITSYARFLDRLQRDPAGNWKILSRVAIYEKDRIDPVGPSVLFWLINRFANYSKYPKELRHLAYGLERKGSKLASDIVTSGSTREERLKSDALAWLGGGQKAALP